MSAGASLTSDPSITPRDISITRMAVTASSQHAGRHPHFQAANAIDGNARSGWESARNKLPKVPQYITLELDTPCVVDALRYFGEGRGRIKDYEIQVSSDGKQFTTVAAGQWDPQGPPEERVTFTPVETRHVRLIAKSGWANVARANEIALESPDPLPPQGDVTIPPAADADARLAVFAARQSPETLEKVADQLSRFLRSDAPELTAFADRYRQGDINSALQAFKQAFAARLIQRREILEDMPFLKPVNPRIASLLLDNIVKISDGRFVDLGKAGSIDWDNDTAFANSPHVGIFNQLLGFYEQTGDRAYLEKWAELVDDMVMHHRRDRLRPFEISNQDRGAWKLLHLLNRLMSVEKARPGSLEALPPGTLPRLLMAVVPQDIALNATFFSSYPGNWYPENCARQVQLGLLLDDLIAMDTPLIERGMDGLGLYGVRANLPDGTEAEPSWGYNHMFLNGALGALNQLNAENFTITPPRRRELLEDIVRRARWLALSLTFERRQPLVLRQDGRQWPVKTTADDGAVSLTGTELGGMATKLLDDPWIAQAVAAHNPEAKTTLGSIFFPYGGYAIIRENWTQAGQYGFMMSRPYVSPFGTRGVTDNLNLGVHAFGHDLLVDGVTTLYRRTPSQLRVNGRDQFFLPDYQNPKEPFTAKYLTDAWEKPSPARWLHSESFDFMEGTYTGRYGSERYEEHITDTTHQRQVVFARDAGLWIVVDRVQATDQPHDFTWHWMLPCSAEKESILTYKPEDIRTEQEQKHIFTRKPDSANISLRTFTKTPLIFSSHSRLTASKPSGKVCIIDATAKQQKQILALTAILPRRALEDDLTDVVEITDDKVEGFSASTPNGAQVRCLAARTEAANLQSGSITARGKLLITVEQDEVVEGLVLGCESLKHDGKALHPRTDDFVFTLSPASVSRLRPSPVFKPILPAIGTVDISPATNVFIGKQKITLSCPTPDVEIRYTLNGGEPSRSSQLYKRPFTIRDTTRLRARAFRIDREAPEGTLDFTLASAESSAYYKKQKPLPAIGKSTPTKPGLASKYYEGNWQKLYINSNLVEPVAVGTVTELFALTPRKNTGPFTFVYDGFIEVPKTGVYTFHAPLELIDNRLIDAGYDLYLEIDGHPWQPAMRRHAFGDWSIALEKGRHRFHLKWVDYRGDLVVGYNRQGERQELTIDHNAWDKSFDYLDMIKPLETARRACDFVWVGPPRLEVSGPDLETQPLPAQWLQK